MKLEDAIFAYQRPDEQKLIKAGFVKEEDQMIKRYDFLPDEFYAIIRIENNHVDGCVYDCFSDEEYPLVHKKGTLGSFSAQVKEAYQKLLIKLSEACFVDLPVCVIKCSGYGEPSQLIP